MSTLLMTQDTTQISTDNNHNSTMNYNTSTEIDIDYSDSQALDRVIAILVPIVFGLIVMVGFFGNGLVVIVVSCNQQMRNTTNLLIINLAVADLLFIVFCVPFTATDYVIPFWPFGLYWCKIVQYLIVVCAYTSVYTLVLMSVDRFLAVVYPVEAMAIRTERNTILAILAVWAISVLCCIPWALAHGFEEYTHNQEDYNVCRFKDTEHQMIYQIVFFLSSYAIPLTIICVLYLFMLKRLWYGVVPGGRISADSIRGKKRATRMVVIVVVVFAVCWCPIQVVLLLQSLKSYPLNTGAVAFQICSQVLAYMNSCVNPILYAFLSENFRKAFHKVISCGVPQQFSAHNRQCSEKNDTRNVNTKSKRYTSNDTETTQAML